ncbi:MAG: hypothetical protein SOW56_01700, partial [Bacteroidaceae bacterium]|nr:hypothetical protein [Bacteroidaceae bacterium]
MDENYFPFKFSNSATKNPSWYVLRINRNSARYCKSTDNNITLSNDVPTTPTSADAFCFVGSPFGFKLYNAANPTEPYGPAATAAGAALAKTSAEEAATFVFEYSSETGFETYQLLRNVTDPVGYLNDTNLRLAYWLSTNNRHDAGSNFSFVEVVEPESITVDGIKYLIDINSGEATVTYPCDAEPTADGMNTYTGDIVIPDVVEYNGWTYPVTAIGRAAFCRSTITSLVIGDNVKETGYDCCAYTKTLKKVVIGEGVTKMNQGFGWSTGNVETVIVKPTTPPTIGAYIFSGNVSVTVKASSIAAYKANSAWAAYKPVPGVEGFEFNYDELQNVIASYDGKYTAGTNPGFYSAASIEALQTTIDEAKTVTDGASADDILNAVKAVVESAENISVVAIEDGKYYCVVTAGNGNGYSDGPYNYEYKNAIYNGDGYLAWKAWDKKDLSQMYKFTSDGNGNWYLQSLADGKYFGKGTGFYGCKVTVTAAAENAQTLTLTGDGNGKFAMTWAGNANVYSMANSHNGSADVSGYLGVWGSPAEAIKYGVNQWYIVEADADVIALVEAKAALQEYYDEVAANYAKMIDPSYDDINFTGEIKGMLGDKLTECKAALLGSTATADDYNTLVTELKALYESCPFVEGGYVGGTITIADLTDGSKIMLEAAPTDYQGKFMTAYPDVNSGNSVMIKDAKADATIWQLEATGETDAIYTEKATYYLKDTKSGKYFGTNDLAAVVQGNKRMVDDKANAYAFSFLTKEEIDAKEGRNMNTYGVANPVFVQHSNADGSWFRLSRFGTYEFVYYCGSAGFGTINDWMSWNLHSGASNFSIADELASVKAEYGSITIPNVGTNPGCISEEVVTPFSEAVAALNDLTDESTRQEIRNAIDSVKSKYNAILTAEVAPIVDGYYFIESAWDSKAGQNIVAYDPNDGNSKLANHVNANSAYDIFKLTTVEDGKYTLQNLGSGLYVGQAGASTNEVSLVETPIEDVYQTFIYDKKGQFKWKDTKTTFTYYIYNDIIGRYYQQSTGSFDSWYLRAVPQELIDEYDVKGGVWEIASEATAPAAGKTYAIKNVTNANYLTMKGVEGNVNVLNNTGVWTLEATGEQEDGLDTYYFKSVDNGLYWKKEDWAN